MRLSLELIASGALPSGTMLHHQGRRGHPERTVTATVVRDGVGAAFFLRRLLQLGLLPVALSMAGSSGSFPRGTP